MIKELLKNGENRLRSSGLPSPRLEAEYLLSGLLQTKRTDLYLHWDAVLPSEVRQLFSARLERRSRREPAAYIEGRKVFMGLDFRVDPRVLIPRPETELLVEKAIDRLGRNRRRSLSVCDMGTGSGCIAVSLARLCPETRVWGVDFTEESLGVARVNAKNNGVADRIEFVKSNLFERFGEGFEGYFDMIVANPPYISESDYTQLEPELYFEPQAALKAGPKGLDVIAPLIRQSGRFLKAGGGLLLEIGWNQGDAVKMLMKDSLFTNVKIEVDLDGKDRMAMGTWHG